MCISINTIKTCKDRPDSMTGEEIGKAMLDDEYIGMLSELIYKSWPSTKAEVQKHLQPCWSFRGDIAIIDGIAMTGIIINDNNNN